MPDIFVSSHKSKKTHTPPPLSEAHAASDHREEEHKPEEKVGKIGRHVSVWSNYTENPRDVSLLQGEEGETLLLFLRPDFVTNIPWMFTSVLLIFIPLVLQGVAKWLFVSSALLADPTSLLLITTFYYIIVVTYIFINFITWYFNISIITDVRVLDVDFSGLVYKHIAETRTSQITDVSYSQIGAIRSLFDYGEVLVQTEAVEEKFILEAVPKPAQVMHIVAGLIHKGDSA